jgi:hypothetical protein
LEEKDANSVKHIEDFKIGKNVEVSIYRFSQAPVPVDSSPGKAILNKCIDKRELF